MTNEALKQAVYPCYVESEIQRIQEHNKPLQSEGFKANITVSFDGEKTKNLALTWEQLEAIKQILIK